MIDLLFRRLALMIMAHAAHIAPPDRRDWAAAMAGELDYMASGRAALGFSLGAAASLWRVRMNLHAVRPLMRWGLFLMLFAWAGAKIYLFLALATRPHGVLALSFPGLMQAGLIGAAFCYGAAAAGWLTRRPLVFCSGLLAALALTMAQHGFVIVYEIIGAAYLAAAPSGFAMFFLAIISEDYFMWIVFLALALIGCVSARREKFCMGERG